MAKNHGWFGCLKKITVKVHPEVSGQREPSRIGTHDGSAPANATGSLTRVIQPAYTLRLRPEPEKLPLMVIPSDTAEPQAMTWYGITDTGKVRDHNEDTFSIVDLEDHILFVVADGMGGHDAGDVASRIAVDTVCREVREGMGRAKDLERLVEHAIQKANDMVRREGVSRGSNMGTTISLALVSERTAYIGSVGDSRVYWMEQGSITRVTEDHSLVAKLVATGKLTEEEARRHPRANLLYRSIGTDENVTVETVRASVNKCGFLLLCTDGLWGDLPDAIMHQVCAEAKDVRAAGERLVQMANENGGKDNITVIVVKIA